MPATEFDFYSKLTQKCVMAQQKQKEGMYFSGIDPRVTVETLE